MKDLPNQPAVPLGDTTGSPSVSSLQPSSGSTGVPPDLPNRPARLDLDRKLKLLAVTSPEVIQKATGVIGREQIEWAAENAELRASQVSLETSQAHYLDLYELAPVGYVTLDQRGLIMEINLTGALMLGGLRSTLLGRPLSQFIFKDDLNLYRPILGEAALNPTELRLVLPDGTEFWVQFVAMIIAGEGASALRRIMMTDISKLKLREWELGERKKKLRCLHDISVLQLLPDISVPALMEGIVELIPPAWQFPEITAARITLEKETFQTKNFRETPWIQAGEIVVNGHPVGRLEVSYIEKRPARDEGPFLAQERNVLNTIAERIGSFYAHRQLAGAAARLALATRAGGVGIWEYDVVNNRLVWDDQMYGLYGIKREQFSGAYEAWQSGLHPEDHQRGDEEIQLALRGEREFDTEFRVIWPDGTIRHIRANAVVQRDQSSQPLRMIGTNWDITMQHQVKVMQKELEVKSQQVQKSESLGRMAGAIAHHFNNQLQVVMLNLELELAGSNRPGKAGSGGELAVAMHATRKAAELSGQMLTYLGQSHVRKEPLDLAETCRQSLALLKSTLLPGVEVETDLPSPGPGLHANASEIKQVLLNLITNAVEARSAERGAIRLSVKMASAAEILAADHFPVDWQPQATVYACLEVTDSGAGIAAAEIQKIFDPFYSTKFTGRGLGLSVVLGIARSHDGVVMVKSEPGRGSAFRVCFPELALAVPKERVPVQLAPVRSKVRPCTVLVVEDNSELRETLALALEFSKFKVFTAGDGIEAMELFRQHRDEIDCVLCDVVMPRMNGWETLTALRQLEPGLPVILASGYDETEVMQGDHAERPQSFLKKPFELEACEKALRRLMHPAGVNL